MYRLLNIPLAALVLAATIVDTNANALHGDQVGQAQPNEFPFVVCIINKNNVGAEEEKIKCTGSLISRKYVLTAAHCLEDGTDVLQVVVGSIDMTRGERYDVLGGITFTEWAKLTGQEIKDDVNDVAILKLAKKIENRNQKVAAISAKRNYELRGITPSVAGWGDLQDDRPSRYLRVASVPFMATRVCEENIKRIKKLRFFSLPGNLFCTEARHAMLARGDSGGPLFYKGNKILGVNVMGCFETNSYSDQNQQNIHMAIDQYRFFVSEVLQNGKKYISADKATEHEDEFNAPSCSWHSRVPFVY